MTTAAFIPLDILARTVTKETINVDHVEHTEPKREYRAFYPPTVGETDLGLFQFTTSNERSRS